MKLSALRIDNARLEEGAWVGDIPELEGVRLHVRGLGNTDFRRLQNKLVMAVPRKNRRNGLSLEDQARIEARCLAETVLLGWEGLENEDGSPLDYSPVEALRLLSNPDFVRLREGVNYAAAIVAEDDAEADEDLEGNSEPASAGT
ncbi:hypothetical protein GCM10008171_32940 [Methylopila jiangsuensis]|uniref:Phage tail assembly chaperone n=1 Tax=Methylopila jiangsuensis TaxID=586230 RepID=A0A9W6N550_9HYPH|nr:hypothetical protein [Methylopila jiangsuensis]MDR6284571.1 hypothetical protein [Methylopila jiangsuensis]GLK78040.1 hypothetical protein GCM10008171_32940 [Methylopila jiangsuensis]